MELNLGFKSMVIDRKQGELFMKKVRESASSVLEFARQWDEYDNAMKSIELSLGKKEERLRLLEDSITERLGLLQEKEKEFDLKQSVEAKVMRLVLEMQNEEAVAQHKAQEKLFQDSMVKKYEELMRELEARENEFRLLDETIKEKSNELLLKVEAEAKEIEVKRKFLEVKEKKLEQREKMVELMQKNG